MPTAKTMNDILHPGASSARENGFPDAPDGWSRSHVEKMAAEHGMKVCEDCWEAIRVLQGCYRDEVAPRVRLLHDALEARFKGKGGIKHLFSVFPAGPIAQGCLAAGLRPPAGSVSHGGGTVQ